MEETITKKAQKPEISVEQFEALDIRICLITSIERVPDTDKLYKMEIHTGFDMRTVVSSIADRIPAEKLLNKNIPFVLNLAPRKIKKIESTAMIILAENPNDKHLSIIGQDEEKLEVGAIVI